MISSDQSVQFFRAIAPTVIGSTIVIVAKLKTSGNPWKDDAALDYSILYRGDLIGLRRDTNEKTRSNLSRAPHGQDADICWHCTIAMSEDAIALGEVTTELYAKVTPTASTGYSEFVGRLIGIEPRKSGIVRLMVKDQAIPLDIAWA